MTARGEESPDASLERYNCPTCGNLVNAKQRFCGECGSSLIRKCGVCGTLNPFYHRFCSNCGNPLGATPDRMAPTIPREERRLATVMFADVSGFTAISEKMDAEDVMALAGKWTQKMSQIVERFGGSVLSLIGDEVLAVFGAPVAHEDDAERAVRAGLALRELNLSDESKGEIRIHVGINTGEVMAGLIGGTQRMRDYTVIGDTVNTAARLRTAAPPGVVLVGEETYLATRHVIHYRQLLAVQVKGKEQPVNVWEALKPIDAPRARPLGTAPLIGRDEELLRLEQMWQRVTRDAQPHLVTILGEAGIGKTRLVAEFERQLPPDVMLLHGRCLPYGEALGYWALAMILKEAADIRNDDDGTTARAKIGELVSRVVEGGVDATDIARHLALLSGLDVEEDRANGGVEQRLLHASTRSFFEFLAKRQPLYLLFEDIHWADDALLDLIETIAGRIRDAPLLIVTQARPVLVEKRPGWARHVRSFTSIYLAPLSESLERQLLEALLQQWNVDPDMLDKLGRSAGGNPLFAEELVAMIAEGGLTQQVPSVIKMLISARLDTLPELERRAIQLASVFGKVFWVGGLRALAPELSGELPELLEALEQKDLLRAQLVSQFRDDREYAFKHDLIRDVAYEMLPRAERRRLHGGIVGWLEQTVSQQIDLYYNQFAHHAVQAEQPERAVNYLSLAAERAERAAAFRHAASLLAQAISIAEPLGRSDLLCDLYLRRATALGDVGLWKEAQPALEAALAHLTPGQSVRKAELLLKMAEIHFWLFNMPEVRHYANEALVLAEEAGRDDLVAVAIARLAEAEASDGDLLRGLDTLNRVPKSTEHLLRAHNGDILYWLGRYQDALPYLTHYIEKKSGETAGMINTKANLGMVLAGTGHYDEAIRVFAETAQLAREYEIWPFLARTIACSAGMHLDLFDYEGHEAIAHEALEVARSADFIPTKNSASIDLLLNYARSENIGRTRRLLDTVAEGIKNTKGFHSWLWALRFNQARSEIALARNDWEEALDLSTQGINRARFHGRVKYEILALLVHASTLAKLNRTHDALADLEHALSLARSLGDPVLFIRVASLLLRIDGNDELATEAREKANRVVAVLPDSALRRCFLDDPVVRAIGGVEDIGEKVVDK